MYSTNYNDILYTSRQFHCHEVYKIQWDRLSIFHTTALKILTEFRIPSKYRYRDGGQYGADQVDNGRKTLDVE